MIFSMGAGQLDLWSRVSHSHSCHHVSLCVNFLTVFLLFIMAYSYRGNIIVM